MFSFLGDFFFQRLEPAFSKDCGEKERMKERKFMLCDIVKLCLDFCTLGLNPPVRLRRGAGTEREDERETEKIPVNLI